MTARFPRFPCLPRIPVTRPRPIPLRALILLFAVLAAGPHLAARAAAAVPGDVNGDGIINLVDPILIKDHLIERAPLTGDALSRADANQDGHVDLQDVAWAAEHRYVPPVSTVSGRVELPDGTPLDPASLALISPAGEAPLSASWEFSNLPVWNTGAGQFLFLDDAATSDSLLMMYVAPEEVQTSPLDLTTTHTATALLALHPACFCLDDRQRRELLGIAKAHADFPDLVLMIGQAVETSPTLVSDYDHFPAIYELAGAIGNDAAGDWRDSQAASPAPQLQKGPLSPIAPLSVVGRSVDPHLDDWPGNGMTLVNPDLLFYGVQWGPGARQWTVLRGKAGATQLIPPGWTPDVEEPVELGDGDYMVEFWKGAGGVFSPNPAERTGNHANILKLEFAVMDILAPPGSSLLTGVINNNELIESLAENSTREFDDLCARFEAAGNLISYDDWFRTARRVLDFFRNGGVYEGGPIESLVHIVGWNDKVGRSFYSSLQSATWLDQLAKAAKVYDFFTKLSPFAFQVVCSPLYPNHYSYQISVSNGILYSTQAALVPPDAQLGASKVFPAVGETVNFDASATTDDRDTLEWLRFRFDFENDGVWDTAWTVGNATTTHAYASAGPKTCVVQVMDTDNLTAEACQFLYVCEAGSGWISIHVTPNSGQWRLFGPPTFTPVSGTGDFMTGPLLPLGSYTLLCYDNVPGYDPPALQTQTLAAGQTLAFNATWTPEGGQEITFTLPGGVPLVMKRIPAGSFQMGRQPGERSSYSFEDPRHTVNIGYSFYLGKCEITQKQWQAVTGANPVQYGISQGWGNYGLGDNYPAYYVSWDDCQSLLTTLNGLGLGGTFRLPSESEWEYACRAGTSTRFFFGDSLSADDNYQDGPAGILPGNRSDYMWWGFNESQNTNGQYGSGTHPIGAKLPNQWGLYDMSGNVEEWCQDWWHTDYSKPGRPDNGGAWNSQQSGYPYRLCRGGSWHNDAYICRSAHRWCDTPANRRSDDTGVRLSWTQ